MDVLQEMKIISHCMRCVFIVKHQPKIMEVKTRLYATSVKPPLTSRVNPLVLKWINMVEKYANSRDLLHSLTNNALMLY